MSEHEDNSTPTDKYESVLNASNEVNVFSDLDEELNVYNKPDLFPEVKP